MSKRRKEWGEGGRKRRRIEEGTEGGKEEEGGPGEEGGEGEERGWGGKEEEEVEKEETGVPAITWFAFKDN